MNINTRVLRRFIGGLPADARAVRVLLDEVGVEVKRFELLPDGEAALGLELLANRGDHYCYAGIARELSGRTGGALCHPVHATLEVGESPWPLRLETDLCQVYTATLLERVGDGALGAADLEALESCGIHSLGAVIDATNLANLEIGQPTHAFDADRIEGAITLRTSRAGEKAWPLFQPEPVALPEGTLVVADDAKILAIAGVIGCEESKTTPETRRVLLESAAFDPVAVRKASRALQIHTDSSARFERGSDFALPLVGAGRVVQLLEGAGWRRVGTTGVAGGFQDPKRTITLSCDRARAFLATPELGDEDLRSRLLRYGFQVEDALSAPLHAVADLASRLSSGLGQIVSEVGRRATSDSFVVTVPTWRLWDVEFEADLFEELAKSHGYDNTPIGLPPIDRGALPSAAEVVRDAAFELLISHGFHQVITDGFYGRPMRDKLGLTESHPLWAHVETTNALDRAYSLLKNNTFAQAVDAVATNLRVQNAQVRAFEWTRTFHPDPGAENGVCVEVERLWLVANGVERPGAWAGKGRAIDAHFLVGLVEELAARLGLPLVVGAAADRHPLASLLHPGRQASIRLGDRVVGVLGEVHPTVLDGFKIKRERPVYLEIEATALLGSPGRVRYVEPPEMPPVERNLAFSLPHGVTSAAVEAALRGAGVEALSSVSAVDRYDHELDGRPVRTVTYALSFAQSGASFTTEQLNAALERLVAAVHAGLGASGVRLR